MDKYDIKADAIRFLGNPSWIEEIELIKYKKGSEFSTILGNEKININNIAFYKELNETSILINEIDYHYDFVVLLKGKNRIEKHEFSNIVVTEFEGYPFNHSKVTHYKYNLKDYNNDDCDFYLATGNIYSYPHTMKKEK